MRRLASILYELMLGKNHGLEDDKITYFNTIADFIIAAATCARSIHLVGALERYLQDAASLRDK